MYNIYNFEAIINVFLNYRKFPKTVQKANLVLFRSFLNWLTYTVQFQSKNDDVSGILPCLLPETLNKYRQFLKNSKFPNSAIYTRMTLLIDFKEFIEMHPDLPITKVSNPSLLMQKALIDDFLGEIEAKGGSKATMRCYKSDISQFFSFLKQNN